MRSVVSEIKGEAFRILPTIERQRLRIRLEGSADMAAVTSLKTCLAETKITMKEHGLSELELDLTALYLLNSSCIKALVHFLYVLQSEPPAFPVIFVVSPHLTWQPRALAPLERMAPTIVSVRHA